MMPQADNTHALPANLPELRFPEFKDAGAWEIFSIADLCECGLANGVFNDPKKVGKGYKLINVLDMYIETSIQEGSLPLLELSETEFTKNKVNYGDIFFTRSSLVKSGIAYSNIYLGCSNDVTYDGHLIRFRVDQKKINPIFANYILRTNSVREQLVARGKSATMTTIGQADVASVNLCIPLILPEQQKIAACLSSLDDLITTENQQLEALKTHKKGLIQSLFPAEGETVPKHRFPEFKDAGAWVIGVFNDAVSIIDGDRGVNYPKAEEFSNNGFCVFLNAKNVTKNGFAFDEVQFISQNKDTALSKGKLKRSDVILTTRGSIGHFAIFSEDISYDHMRINSGMVILRPDSNLVSSEYLYSFCKSEIMSSTIENVSFGNAQQQLTVAIIKKLPLYYPTSEEQQKIAACLSSLDDLISAQSQKIESLKQHKKGLMQQLFPNSPPLEGWQAQPDGVVL